MCFTLRWTGISTRCERFNFEPEKSQLYRYFDVLEGIVTEGVIKKKKKNLRYVSLGVGVSSGSVNI